MSGGFISFCKTGGSGSGMVEGLVEVNRDWGRSFVTLVFGGSATLQIACSLDSCCKRKEGGAQSVKVVSNCPLNLSGGC